MSCCFSINDRDESYFAQNDIEFSVLTERSHNYFRQSWPMCWASFCLASQRFGCCWRGRAQILGRFFTTSKRPPPFQNDLKTTFFFDLLQNAHVAMRIAVACVTAMWCAKPSDGCEPSSGGAAGTAHLNSVLIWVSLKPRLLERVYLAHRNCNDFCDLRLRCPSWTPKLAPISETLESNAALPYECAMESRWQFAISGCAFWTPNPFFLRDFWRFCSVNAEIASDCDRAILAR